MKIDFSKEDLGVLKILLDNSIAACRSGCVYPKMQDSKINCKDCKYSKRVERLINKLELM